MALVALLVVVVVVVVVKKVAMASRMRATPTNEAIRGAIVLKANRASETRLDGSIKF